MSIHLLFSYGPCHVNVQRIYCYKDNENFPNNMNMIKIKLKPFYELEDYIRIKYSVYQFFIIQKQYLDVLI